MNKILVAFALLLMAAGYSYAGGRQGQGWTVTEVTGTAVTVFSGKGFVKQITLSTGASSDYVIAMTTHPVGAAAGGQATLIPHQLTLATTTIVSLVYQSTTSVADTANSVNNVWTVGDCDTCFVETPTTGGLHIRQTTASDGRSNKVWVLWSK